MSKTLGLNVVLANTVLTLRLLQEEARSIVDKFQTGSLKTIIGGVTTDGQSWALRPEDIKGICTFDIEALIQQQQAAAAKTVSPWNLSGGFGMKN